MAVKPPRGVLLSKAEADRLAKLYMKAELEIVKAINQALERRNDTRYLRAMLENVKKIQADLLKGTRAWSEQAVPRLYREGMKEAESQLQLAGLSVKFGFGAVHQQAVQVLAENSYRRLADVVQVIGRRTEDLYRETALEATRQSIIGYKTWSEVAGDVRKRLQEQGVTAFEDRRGRKWNLSTYSEMVARTTTAEAHLAGTGNRLLENGHDLVIISSHGSPCEKCAKWEGRVISLTGKTPGYPTLEHAKGEGLFHPNCFPAGVLISGPAPLASMTRWYEGQLVVIQTASGIELPVTPNHPILTTKGWVAAGLLVEGDEVIRYVGQERMVEGADPHYQQVPTCIEDVAGAFGESCGMSAFRVPVAPEDFHGDGIGSEICIVRTNSLLRDDVDTAHFEPCGKQRFSLALVDCLCLLGKGAFDQFIGRTLCAPYGGVGRCYESGPILGSHSCQPGFHGFASVGGWHDTGLAEAFVHSHFSDAEGPGNVALGLSVQIPLDDFFCGNRESTGSSDIAWRTDFDAAFAKNRRNEIGADTERTRELVARLAQDIAIDKVVGVDSRAFVGHVYNLQTRDGWYAANTIIAHNCRHTYYWQLEIEAAEKTADGRQVPEEASFAPRVSLGGRRGLSAVYAEAREHGLATGKECVLTIDANSGALVYTKITGTSDSVSFPARYQAFLGSAADDSIIVVHNHPNSSGFSPEDIRTLALPSLAGMGVIGHDGTRYYMGKQPGAHISGPRLVADWWRAYSAHFDYYSQQVLSGRMTEAEAWREHSHRIAEDLARADNLEYRRRPPSGQQGP